jgi:hypothetical protein
MWTNTIKKLVFLASCVLITTATAVSPIGGGAAAIPLGGTVIYHADGTSTQYAPAANTDTARGTALTAAFAASAAGERINIGPGTFQVAAQLTALTGQKIYGNGTTIKMADQGSGTFSNGISVIADTGTPDGIEIHDILFDCNLQNQSASNAIVGAVGMHGTNTLIENCRGINWGSKGAVFECFVFLATNGGNTNSASVVNCTVDTAAPVAQLGGTTGILSNWRIQGCSVHDVVVGTGSGNPAYFNAYSNYSTQGGILSGSSAYNLGPFGTAARAYYTDTGGNNGLLIIGNTFTNVETGINMQVATTYTMANVTITGNYISATHQPISWNTFGTGTITNTTVTNNKLLVVPSSNANAMDFGHSTGAIIAHNVIDSSYSTSVIHDGGSNTGVLQWDNHKLDGTLVALDFVPAPQKVAEGGTGLAAAAVGDIPYGSATNVLAMLSGNTSTTMAVLTQIGSGIAAGVPAWTSTSGTGNLARVTSPTFVTPNIGAATATTVNGNAFTAGTGTLALGSVTLNAGSGGTLGSNAFNSTAFGTGTVTSISGSGGSTGLTLTGGPITTSGTLTLSGTLAIADGGTANTTALAAIQALTAKGADIASASTTDLSTATGTYLNVTGTTTITSFGTVAAGQRFGLKFTNASGITYNGTSMILLGGVSETNANGTARMFESLGSGNWQEIFNNVAGGTPGGSTTQVQYNNSGAFGGTSGETSSGTVQTLTTPVLTGLPTGTGVSASATASTLAARDANANSTSNNFLPAYRTQATAAGTTTLVVGDAYYQYFTGTTTQSVTMPVTTTLVIGQAWDITNLSTGVVTVNTSAGPGTAIVILPANTEAIVTCILASGTTIASWHVNYGGLTLPSGASLIVSGPTVARTKTLRDATDTILELGGSYTPSGTWTSITLVTPALGTPASGALTNCTLVPVNQATGSLPKTSNPVGLFNFAQAAQSQAVTSATEYYITHSDLDMPATYTTAIGAGTTMRWRVAMTKTAAGTGTFQILIKKGTGGATTDTSIVTATIGTQTAALDALECDIVLTWTSSTAAYWTMTPRQFAATGTGFGFAYPLAAQYLSGTITGQTTTTASDKYGLSFISTTGTPTILISEVTANASGVN